MIQVLSNSINCLEKYPVGVWDSCAEVMTEVVKEMRDINMELLVCLFSQEAYNIFSKIFSKD